MNDETKTSRPERTLVIVLGGLLLGLLLFIAAVLVYQGRFRERIFRGVAVEGIEVGGMTREEAAGKLEAELRYPLDASFTFRYDGREWHASPRELGFQVQGSEMANEAWKIGRQGGILDRIAEQISAVLRGKDLQAVFLFDERVAFNEITHIAEEIDTPMGDPAIRLEGSEVVIVPGTTGYQLDRRMTLELLRMYAEKLQGADIELPVAVLEPTEANLGTQKETLESLLSQDFLLYTNDERGVQSAGTIPAEVLAGLIDFEPVISDGNVQITMTPKHDPFYTRLLEIGNNVYRDAIDPKFTFNEYTQALEMIQAPQTGKEIDIEASLENIAESIRAGANQAEIALNVNKPKLDENINAAELGIRELVHTENTYFFYSDDARIQNIQVGAGKLNGVLIAPGETFSMSDAIGEVSKETGYAESFVIFGDATVQDVGGGLCQVSTTLFRAAFHYGLPINERHAHGYRVYYYERLGDKQLDPGLAGMDAAVYLPTLDLQFTNDTPYWILMETDVNVDLCRLQWRFYSTDVNRYVEYETSGLTNVIPQGDPVYNLNPDMAAGEIKQVDWGIDGADVTITRTVYQDGYIYINDKFETHYEAWNDIYEYGPGTEGIPTKESEEESEE